MIPKQKTKPTIKLGDQVITLYGMPKIGKSTFASQFPGVLFAATEPGLNFIEAYQVPVNDWSTFRNLCGLLARDPQYVQTLVVDTIDILYLHCKAHICKEAGVMDPSDLSYGKGFGMVNNEFRRVLSKIGTLRTKKDGKLGLIMISHAKEVEIDTRTGKQMRWAPSPPASARQIIEGMSDLLLFADVNEEGVRVLRTKPSPSWVAGDRSGRLADTMPLNYVALASQFDDNKKKGETK
jgi:hypothetical protein|tara:strand:+ start:827 stop:1537 length:711 start_codon:yes stop_codon:yes gene_type:complete